MILCDIGNSSFHFLINKEEKKYSLDAKLPILEEKIYYISVNEKATKKLKENYKDTIDLEPFINFDTTYIGMGLDRKVVCMTIVVV